MNFRHCVERVTTDLMSHACDQEAQILCSDGLWRCITHAFAFKRRQKVHVP